MARFCFPIASMAVERWWAVLVLRARLFLGYWPYSAHPDPKQLPFVLHHVILWFGFYVVAWGVPVGQVSPPIIPGSIPDTWVTDYDSTIL